MNRVRELVGASEIYRMGYDGTGIGVAVLDSGMDPQHPDLKGRMVYTYNYIGRNQNGSDDCGHGTHICGIIGGNGIRRKISGNCAGVPFCIPESIGQDGKWK